MLNKGVKFIAAALISAMVFICAYAEDEIKIYVNSVRLNPDVNPVIVSGRVLVPLRDVCTAMGLNVSYESGVVTVCDGQTTAVLTVYGNEMSVSDIFGRNEKTYMDVSPIIINDRTMIPARYIAEAFGASAAWDGENKIASFTFPSEPIYDKTKQIRLFAGILGAEGHVDGDMLLDSTFEKIRDITADNLGRIYVSEIGDIRIADNGLLNTINVSSDFVLPKRICANGSTLYFLSFPFEDNNGSLYFGVFKNAYDSFFCVTPQVIPCSLYGNPIDMDIDKMGIVYVLCENALFRIDGEGNSPVKLANLKREYSAVAVGPNGKIFLSGGGSGIYVYDPEYRTVTPFAGTDEKQGMVDGKMPLFVNPSDIAASEDKLYVSDGGRLRIIDIYGEATKETTSVPFPEQAGMPARICIFGDKVYAADINNSVVWVME